MIVLVVMINISMIAFIYSR